MSLTWRLHPLGGKKHNREKNKLFKIIYVYSSNNIIGLTNKKKKDRYISEAFSQVCGGRKGVTLAAKYILAMKFNNSIINLADSILK